MPYHIETRTSPFTTEHFTGLTHLPHIHTQLELIYLEEGASVATADYRDFSLEKGDLFLSFPNQIHFYHDMKPCSGYLFIFSHDYFREIKDIFQNRVPESPVIKKEQLPPDIRDSFELIMQKNTSDSPFDKVAAKGYLLAMLGELLQLMNLEPNSSSHDSIKNILTYCAAHYTESLSLDILSRELHLNKYYISHIFKERMNISFTDFINGLRVQHACSLLEKDANITEIAFASGFSSIRTFNRAFVDHMGMAPRDYLRRTQPSR